MLTCDDCCQSFEPDDGCVCTTCRDALATRVLSEIESANDALRYGIVELREEAEDLISSVEALMATIAECADDDASDHVSFADLPLGSIKARIAAIKALVARLP